MRLADEITIMIGGEAIELRPCLRFAMRLERREGSFASLMREIGEGSLSAAVEIIRDHADMDFLENRVFDVLPELRAPLLAYVMACAGIDPDDAPEGEGKRKSKGKAKAGTFAEDLLALYRIGTARLGWTPTDTLDATPAEIIEAHKGWLELFGGGDDKSTLSKTPLTPEQRAVQMEFNMRRRARAAAKRGA